VGFFVRKNGMFYGGGFALLGQQLVAIFTFIAWSGGFNAIVLSVLKGLGWLRVPESTEREGIDLIQCTSSFASTRRRRIS
jgi:ammonia channel protein AmtB